MQKNSPLPNPNFELICIVGPTGCGKTRAAFSLAKHLDAEIISCDAFQVYRGMAVGTNQPDARMLREVRHHFVGEIPPRESWSASDFALKAQAVVERCASEGKRLIVTGGSGFYLQALLEGVPPGNAPTTEERRRVLHMVEAMGLPKAHRHLSSLDAAAAARIHPNDLKRVTRALEKALASPSLEATVPPARPKAVVVGLDPDRARLDGTLLQRTEKMWRGGLIDEARRLIEERLPGDSPAWGAIGYREAAEYLKGAVGEREAFERVFRRTRQYAKRQMTWFRHHHGTRWIPSFPAPDIEAILDACRASRTPKGDDE